MAEHTAAIGHHSPSTGAAHPRQASPHSLFRSRQAPTRAFSGKVGTGFFAENAIK
jgi:hypothetical protein